MNRIFTFLFVWMCLGWPAVSSAGPENREKARMHFEQGEKYYRQGEFQKALDEYKAVLEYVDAVEMYYNIAQCHRMLKNHENALFFYRRYLARVPSGPLTSIVEKHIAALERLLEEQRAAPAVEPPSGPGKVMVLVEPQGAFVWVDRVEGRPAGTTPLVLDLEPGAHTLVIKKEGYLKRHFPVEVKPAQNLTVEGRLEMDPDAPLLPDPDAMDWGRPRRPGLGASFWTGLAGTGVSLAGLAVFGSLAVLRNREWKRTFDEDVRDEGMLFGDFATGFAVASAGLAAFTLWRYFAAASQRRPKPFRAFVLPFASPEGAGVLFEFPF